MPTKVIVVIQYEDLAVASVPISKEFRGSQPGNTATNHYQVIGCLRLLLGRLNALPSRANA